MSSILIVEDEFSIRNALTSFLAGAGHSVEALASGMEGVQRALQGELDVVVLDLGLPDVDGSEVLKMIRAVSTVPVIVATARDDEEEIVRILKSGADDYTLAEEPVDLTRKEFDLLAYLASRAGAVASKRELLAEVWRQPYGGADKTVDVHLSVLRRKLGETAAEPRYLRTVHGVGVKLVDPDS